MPLRMPLRLVIAGLVSLAAALMVIAVIPTHSASNPDADASAGSSAWAVVEQLFPPATPSEPSGGVSVTTPDAPAPASVPAPVQAKLPPAAAITSGGRFAAIDRHATAPVPAAPAAPVPAPVAVAPPASAPVPAPVPVAPAPSLLDAVTTLVANLLGLLVGG